MKWKNYIKSIKHWCRVHLFLNIWFHLRSNFFIWLWNLGHSSGSAVFLRKTAIPKQCFLSTELDNDCSSTDWWGYNWYLHFLTHYVCSQATFMLILSRALMLGNERRSRVPFHGYKVNCCIQRASAMVVCVNAYQVLKGIHLLIPGQITENKGVHKCTSITLLIYLSLLPPTEVHWTADKKDNEIAGALKIEKLSWKMNSFLSPINRWEILERCSL